MTGLTEAPAVNTKRVRNIHFEGIPTKVLDTVFIADNNGGGEEVFIPALHRTNYWAILRYMYLNHSRKVYFGEFVKGVSDIMDDADILKWERFKSKGNVKTVKFDETGKPCLVEQGAKSWQSRVITNGRNLCRIGTGNAYGRRLLTRGHVMRYETDADGRGFFVLYLTLTPENTAPRKRGRKPARKELVHV
jgi:hypothetical protein